MSLRMPTFSSDGLTYAYTEGGRGPTVLLLHGFTGSSANWEPLQVALVDSYRVIALDLPGHGASDAPADPVRYTMAAVATDIDRFLDWLQTGPPHLLGYSMGGRLALYLALTRPARWRSVILESASPGLETPSAQAERVEQDVALADWIEAEGIEAFVDRWEALPLFASQRRLSPTAHQAHRAGRLKNRPHGLANSLRGMGIGAQPSLWPRLDELSLPTLLLAGELDEKFVAIAWRMVERLSVHPPYPHLEIVPEAGHTVHLERPRYYAELLRAWLAAV